MHTKLKKPQSSFARTDENRENWASLIFMQSENKSKMNGAKCGYTSQTVWHILMECRKFNRPKAKEIYGRRKRRKEPFWKYVLYCVVEWKKMLTYIHTYIHEESYRFLCKGTPLAKAVPGGVSWA